MDNNMEQKEVIKINELEQAGLFYKMVSRRPMIDIIPEKEEEKFWQDNYKHSNDITLYSWRDEWKKNTKENIKHFGHFNRDNSVKIFANECINKPIILLGAGPSLEKNIDFLRLAKANGVAIMASHHTLMYLAEKDITPDYVAVLDAGQMWDEYWAFDKLDLTNVPLMTEQTCNHEQLKKYTGPVKFFKSSMPDGSNIGKFINMELDRIVDPAKTGSHIEVGGHVMGAMMSLARGVLRADTLIFAGCDYCFNPQGKFYPFDHKIDQTVDGKYFEQEGKELPSAPPAQGVIFDIFGQQVATNGSYLGFKNVMDQAIKVNMASAYMSNDTFECINATEGGALGALAGGNSRFMKYMRLEDAIHYVAGKRAIYDDKEKKRKEGKK